MINFITKTVDIGDVPVEMYDINLRDTFYKLVNNKIESYEVIGISIGLYSSNTEPLSIGFDYLLLENTTKLHYWWSAEDIAKEFFRNKEDLINSL